MQASKKSEYVVVGGGVVGLSIAYHLAKLGASVTIVEKRYVGSGSSTRNAANARAHFFNREASLLAWESLKRMRKLSRDLGYNTLFVRRGYLWLFYKEEHLEAMRRYMKTWKELGIPEGKILGVDELAKRYPYLNLRGIVGGYLADANGRYHHDAVVRAYWINCRRLGVSILEYVEARKVLVRSGRAVGVETSTGAFEAEKAVVLAAGPWTRVLAETVGVELPIEPIRKEAMVTEPLKITIKPLVINTKVNAYAQQTLRGEVLLSSATPLDVPTWSYQHTYQFPIRAAKAMVETIPALATVNWLRQWAGHYATTPDHNPVLGYVDEVENLAVASGFSGHGFMLAPAVGEFMALLLEKGYLHPVMAPFDPGRFKEGRMIREDLVIG